MSKRQLAHTHLNMALKRGQYNEILKHHQNLLRVHAGNVFIHAVKKGDMKTIQRLIKGDRNIPPINIHHTSQDHSYDYEEQAIHIASRLGKLALVRLLLKAGASPNAKTTYDEYRPLHSVAISDHRRGDIAKELLAQGASVDARSDEDTMEITPLMRASMDGNLPVVRVLIEHGANVNARSLDGKTPLYYAVIHGHAKIVQFLLNHGANVNIPNTNGKLPIHVVGKSSTIAKILVKHGAQNARAPAPLHWGTDELALATQGFITSKNVKRIVQAPTRIAARKELEKRSLPPELVSTILQYANLSNAGPYNKRNESKNNARRVPRKRKSTNTPKRSTRRRTSS